MKHSPPAQVRSRWAPGAPLLAHAARAVAAVAAHGRSTTEALNATDPSVERAALQALLLGTLRWYLRLLPAVQRLLRGQRLDAHLRALLVVAAHQIEYSRHAPQPTVHAAVDAARILGEPRASGLVNAVLRRFLAERATLLAQVDADEAASTAHPAWLVEALGRAWPAQRATLLAADNEHPPLVLRVDASRVERRAYLEELEAAGLPGEPLGWAPQAVRLLRPAPASLIPGIAAGRVSVQDAGAQRAAVLLGARTGMRVLDACAAPGGKTLHLLELAGGPLDLLAIDVDAKRLERVAQNLARAGRTAKLEVIDALQIASVDSSVAVRCFDRILLDVPCSATGVIRRHPDIKLLRRPTDIAAFARTQLQLLRSTYRVLAPGGRLLYCTCSVLPQENEQVVEAFLREHPEAGAQGLPPPEEIAPGAVPRSVGVQLLPGGPAGSDGFYYACLEKTTASTTPASESAP
ncbi:MAG TPA: 16S rRNA (cytosine(967)-C(5))-methyltransferase RsmB [Steroidobacteraceae bacterium]|nr:16S rRNA (cytosine(967)-C(5))-methyltransferase RsmB [Steroidobacteraceae bacterium]